MRFDLLRTVHRDRIRTSKSGTEKVPQRTFATKISPNFRVNFLVRFASKPLFYWVVPSNCSEKSLVLFARFLGFGVLLASEICDRDAHRRPQKSQRFPRQEKAILPCDLRVQWKVASDLRFRGAISEPKIPSFCGSSGDLTPSTRKSLAIAIVRYWCAKAYTTMSANVATKILSGSRIDFSAKSRCVQNWVASPQVGVKSGKL